MEREKVKSIIAIFLCFSFSLNAQTSFSRVSVDLGIIRNYQYNIDDNKIYSFYPELKIGGNFLTNYLEWELYTSYWDDGIKEAFNVRDAVTYSYSSFVLGNKFCFFPKEIIEDFFWPFYLSAGISYRKINEKYVGGSDYTGNYRENNTSNLITYDIGFGVYFAVFEKVRLRIDSNICFPFKENDRLYNDGKNGTIKLGADYLFD